MELEHPDPTTRPPADPHDPTHLVDTDATTTRCGIPLHRRGAHPYPYVAAEHAAMHIRRRGMAVCPACAGIPWLRRTDDDTWTITDRD